MSNPNFELIMDPSNDKFKDECGVFGVFAINLRCFIYDILWVICSST